MIDVLLFCLLAALWGGSFVAIKFVVADFSPVFGAALRVSVALAALFAIFSYQRKKLDVPAAVRRRMWLAGLFAQGLPFALLFWGERRISPGLAGIINGTVPLWTFCIGFARKTETVSSKKVFGLALGFLGIGVICAPAAGFGGTGGELAGIAAVLLMAVCYAIGSLMTRSILSGSAKADFRSNAFHQNCASAFFLLCLALISGAWASPGVLMSAREAWLGTIYLGVFSTALAFLIYFHLIREWGAVRASAVTYVAPVIALFWDYVFFKNVPPPSEILGVAAILSGVVLLQRA